MLRLVGEMIVSTAEETGGGPESMFYLPLAEKGMDVGSFSMIVAALKEAGKIKVYGNCIYPA